MNNFSRRSVLTFALPGALLAFALPRKTEAAEKQPHMAAALSALRNAQTELAAATADKGGHRVAAEKAVRAAIAEVEKGIKYDNSH